MFQAYRVQSEFLFKGAWKGIQDGTFYGNHREKNTIDHIIRNVIGNAYSRRVKLGLKMIEYFNKQKVLLGSNEDVHNISSDIIESDFGIYKAKKSPNKLYGITSLVLILPLYPKITEYSVTDKQDFKVRLVNIKLKDVDSWTKKNLSQDRVSLRTKTLRNVG